MTQCGHPKTPEAAAHRIKGLAESIRITADFMLTMKAATAEQRRYWFASVREDAYRLLAVCERNAEAT